MKKLLVANRGEIALRIFRTCRELGIQTVAVYSEADASAPYVRYADERCCIGPAPAGQSYLHLDRLFGAVQQTHADALHPGYGFLSENPLLSQRCVDEGILFLGPSPESIRLMGSKIQAKSLMMSRNVPVVPGETKAIENLEEAHQKAEKLGYPVLVKAAFGGGGKGMRVAYSSQELEHKLREAQSEAQASFQNGQVFIEKFILSPRHIEIQIFSDTLGNHIYLGERECSIQRRHQKLIEESPSVLLDPELRYKMGTAAVEVAKAAHYRGAGTVEFLVDAQKNFYFLEMNTRLQVEHPVTEMVLGMDLVAEQIRVARGLPLSRTQNEIRPQGWAIECRICAEEPQAGFIPSFGKIRAIREPAGPFVRVDSGICQGQEISSYYDSMLSKVIVWGENRTQALARMIRALKDYKIVGIQTNIPFQLQILNSKRFQEGKLSIQFIEEEKETLFQYPRKHAEKAQLIAMALEAEYRHLRLPLSPPPRSAPSRWKSTSF